MAVIPQLMFRVWDGDPDEYFQASDMIRVESNLNVIRRYANLPPVDFISPSRTSQFRYDEAQKLEDGIREVSEQIGIPVNVEKYWRMNRVVSCIDFDRWESQQWKIYKAMGGYGGRIPSDKKLHTYHATLYPDSWKGDGPYFMDVEIVGVAEGEDIMAHVSEDATVLQRGAEFNARLQVKPMEGHRMRVYALGLKPEIEIPIEVTTRCWDMYKQIKLKSGNWKGEGPWTQTVDMGSPVKNAVVGSDERNSSEQVGVIADAVMSVSDMDGSAVTIRAIGRKPEIDVYVTLAWVESEVERWR